jgi:hypothetical protein
MELSNYSKKEKLKIIKNGFKKISNEIAIADFLKLRTIKDPCSGDKNRSIFGIKLINKFTILERLNTKGRTGYSFFDLYYNKDYLFTKNYIKNLYEYALKKYGHISDERLIFDIQGLYFGRSYIFRPIIAMQIYCMFKCTSILDMTMGWGGRLVGACALNIKKYTGIDLNKNLEIPYKNMVKLLDPLCDTNIELYFGDAINFDYENYYYDLVLTSPPYYNIEIYGNQKRRTNEEWDNNFYIPLIQKSFNGLVNGGHYCLNIPIYLYESVAVPLLGEAHQTIPLTLISRGDPNTKKKYKEYIYVWKK